MTAFDPNRFNFQTTFTYLQSQRTVFQECFTLELIRSYSPSYGWRSIVSGRSLVSKGLIKRWDQDHLFLYGMVLGSQPLTRDQQTSIKKNLYPNLTVDSLIDSTSHTWNSKVIRSLVEPEDAKIIESIPGIVWLIKMHDILPLMENIR